MRNRLAASIAVLFAILGVVLGFSSVTFAQTGEQSGTTNAPVAVPALPHDLSGVWMQYPRIFQGVLAWMP